MFRRSARPVTALVAVALLAQVAALPLLHGQHGTEVRAAALLEWAESGSAAAPQILAATPASPAHDAATCVVCAALLRTGVGLIAPRAFTPALATVAALPSSPALAPPRSPHRGAAAPRAPPALVS